MTVAPSTVEDAHGHVERLIGRPLRPAEKHMDVVRLNAALNGAKDTITEAIRVQQRRAVRRALRVGGSVRIPITRKMLVPLERLHRVGREEALLELQRAGYTGIRQPTRSYAAADDEYTRMPWLDPLTVEMRAALARLSVRVNAGLVGMDLGELSAAAIARSLMAIPGGRDLASQVVSRALTSGLALTFEANQDLVGGWEQTAVLDGATCDPCDQADGTEFQTWEEAQATMPDGGPFVDCDGGDRCRCRLVPLPAGG